jgi:hypothetical protein
MTLFPRISLSRENEKEEHEEQPEIDWENVTLCGDGTCIGIIDSNGRCRKCGKTYEEGIAADKSKTERSKQQ